MLPSPPSFHKMAVVSPRVFVNMLTDHTLEFDVSFFVWRQGAFFCISEDAFLFSSVSSFGAHVSNASNVPS